MLDTIKQFGSDAFHWLNDFGQEYWGFIIGFVFIWWALDKMINIIWSMFRQIRAVFNWLRGRRNKRRADQTSELMKTGTPFIPDSARNSTSEPADEKTSKVYTCKYGKADTEKDEKIIIPNLDDVELISSKPGPRSYPASSQAGLASHRSGRLDLRNMHGVDGQNN